MIQVLVDENLSEYLAEGINSIQQPLNNGIKVVSMRATFGKGVKDEDWIPTWGKKDGIFLTQDINITRTRHLAELLAQYQLRAFFLRVPNKTSYWERVEVLIKHWPEIVEIILTRKKPYNYLVSPLMEYGQYVYSRNFIRSYEIHNFYQTLKISLLPETYISFISLNFSITFFSSSL